MNGVLKNVSKPMGGTFFSYRVTAISGNVVHDGSVGADTLIADLCVWESQTHGRSIDGRSQDYTKGVLNSADPYSV